MEVRGEAVQNVSASSPTRGKRTMSNADIRGRFIWHELVTTDPDAASDFYSKVVPWKTQDSGMPSYTLWMAGKTQVGGLTGLPDGAEAGTPPHWIVYIATPDVDATVAEAERLGGKVVKGATDIPNMGRFAVLADPQGAAFAVYTPPGPPPEGSGGPGGPGHFNWHELATTDYAAALDFYVALFGWEKGPTHDMGAMGIYQIINQHGAQVGGIYNLQGPATPPNWLSYVQVADCEKATAAAKAAGGRVLNGPIEVPGGSWITMLMDPQGGAFAVVEPPKVAAQKPAAKAKKPKAAAKADTPVAVSKPEAAPPPMPAAAKKAPAKAAKKGKGKAPGKKAPARKAVGKKAVKKAAKKSVKKVAGKAAKKRPAAKSASAKRGKSAAKKAGAAGKRAGGRKGKRRGA
jgi:predicted enzyme related to lactoylglutathione lyase